MTALVLTLIVPHGAIGVLRAVATLLMEETVLTSSLNPSSLVVTLLWSVNTLKFFGLVTKDYITLPWLSLWNRRSWCCKPWKLPSVHSLFHLNLISSVRVMVGPRHVAKLKLLLPTLNLETFLSSMQVKTPFVFCFCLFSSMHLICTIFQGSCSDTDAHATLVTKVSGSNVYVTCHSTDRNSTKKPLFSLLTIIPRLSLH